MGAQNLIRFSRWLPGLFTNTVHKYPACHPVTSSYELQMSLEGWAMITSVHEKPRRWWLAVETFSDRLSTHHLSSELRLNSINIPNSPAHNHMEAESIKINSTANYVAFHGLLNVCPTAKVVNSPIVQIRHQGQMASQVSRATKWSSLSLRFQ